jgi:hypothetical protein
MIRAVPDENAESKKEVVLSDNWKLPLFRPLRVRTVVWLPWELSEGVPEVGSSLVPFSYVVVVEPPPGGLQLNSKSKLTIKLLNRKKEIIPFHLS